MQSSHYGAPLRKSNRLKMPRQYDSDYVYVDVDIYADRGRNEDKPLTVFYDRKKAQQKPTEMTESSRSSTHSRPVHDKPKNPAKVKSSKVPLADLLVCCECVVYRRRGSARYGNQETMVVCSSSTCSAAAHMYCLMGKKFSENDTTLTSWKTPDNFLCSNCALCKECNRPAGVALAEEVFSGSNGHIWCVSCFSCYHKLCVFRGDFAPTSGWKCKECQPDREVIWKTLSSEVPLSYFKDAIIEHELTGFNNSKDGFDRSEEDLDGEPDRQASVSSGSEDDSSSSLSVGVDAMDVSTNAVSVGIFDRVYDDPIITRQELALLSTDECGKLLQQWEIPQLAAFVRKHTLNGAALLLITREQIIDMFGLALGPALKVHYLICELRRSFF